MMVTVAVVCNYVHMYCLCLCSAARPVYVPHIACLQELYISQLLVLVSICAHLK